MLRDNLELDDPWVLGGGGSGTVNQYDDTTVIKGYISYKDGRLRICREGYETDKWLKERNAREREVYERLNTNPELKVLKYHGAVELEPGHFGIRLEWAKNRDLRTFMRKNQWEDHPFEQRLEWTIDMADTLEGIHSMGVIHCDFSCRNVLVTDTFSLRVADFDGSKLDEKAPMSCEEPWYAIPMRGREWDDIRLMKRELFALGCGIYEVMAWQKPCGDLDMNEVEKAYERGELPDISDVPCADVIRKCWNEEVYERRGRRGSFACTLPGTTGENLRNCLRLGPQVSDHRFPILLCFAQCSSQHFPRQLTQILDSELEHEPSGKSRPHWTSNHRIHQEMQ